MSYPIFLILSRESTGLFTITVSKFVFAVLALVMVVFNVLFVFVAVVVVLVKLVCKDIQAPDFNRYNFEEEYLAIKDKEDETQPYGIIRNNNADIGKILKEIKRSNKLGEPTTELCFCEEYDDVVWELKDEYKFKEVEW